MTKMHTMIKFSPSGGGVEHSPRKGFSDLFPSTSERGWHVVPDEGKNAFTLAEVLITIAIIGVVAAMTIPTLVQNYEERTWNTSASNFERKLGEAMKVMASQSSLVCLGTTEDFVTELSRNMKINKICDSNHLDECFPKSFIVGQEGLDIESNKSVSENKILKPSEIDINDLGHSEWGTNVMGLRFANGIDALVAYNPVCTSSLFTNGTNSITFSGDKTNLKVGTNLISMIYDTSGEVKPNLYSKDIRSINANLTNTCNFKSGALCWGEFFSPVALSSTQCQDLIGNGVGACPFENDYWAGAVLQCKEQGKRLPTQAEWNKVAQYLYGNGSTNTTNLTGTLTLNTDRASKINAPGSFNAWSSNEETNDNTYRYVSTSIFQDSRFTTYQWAGTPKNSAGFMAICVGN